MPINIGGSETAPNGSEDPLFDFINTLPSSTPNTNPVPDASSALNVDGIFAAGSGWVATMDPVRLNQGKDYISAIIGSTATNDFRIGNGNISNIGSQAQEISSGFDRLSDLQYFESISQQMGEQAAILANIAAGQRFIPADPLVLDLNGDGVTLSNFSESTTLFDIDNDGGSREHTGWVRSSSLNGVLTDGIVVHDLNADGVIGNISETLSEYYNGVAGTNGNQGTRRYTDGFAALRSLDSNHDGVFNSADAAWSLLRVWVDDNADGVSFKDANGNGVKDAGEVSELKTFAELGITRINLASTAQSGLINTGNEVLASGSYVRNGVTLDAQAVRFIADPRGSTFSNSANGTTLVTQGDGASSATKSYVSTINTSQTLSAAALGVQNIYAGAGNDTLTGDGGANWLAGGQGSDVFNAGAGDDVLIIDAADRQQDIHGGAGMDIVQVVGSEGVTLNMAAAEVEIFVGGDGVDIVTAGGRQTVFVRAGAGDDVIVGSTTNDILAGEDGNDLIFGEAGNDIVRGQRGRDQLYGGSGDDLLDGGLEDDVLAGGEGNDILVGGQGDDKLDGGEGIDTVQYSGSYADYRIMKLDDSTWRVVDSRTGGDGADMLRNIEKLSFSDVSHVDLTLGLPLPVKDILSTNGSGAALTRTGQHLISKVQLLGNDRDWDSSVSQLAIADVLEAQGGTVSLTASGDVLFTPDPTYTGVMSFKYRIVDETGYTTDVIDPGTGQATPMKAAVYLRTSDLPADPLALEQWYLTDVNVLPVWQDYTGKGVRIGQFEPGGPFSVGPEVYDYRHPDLQGNADLQWLNTLNSLGGSDVPQTFSNHATLVAGVMVGERNGLGGVGIAYDASLSAHVIPDGEGMTLAELESQINVQLAHFRDYDVVNNSWGPTINFFPTLTAAGQLRPGVEDALMYGRSQLGTVIVMAGGNDRQGGGNTNYSNLTSNRAGIVVGAINAAGDLGTLRLGNLPFSNPGASILVSAPGNNIDSTGRQLITDNGSTFGSDYATSQGTSFAAPIVSGVVALMLQANPWLGYRDVQAILAMTATKVDDPNGTDWVYNAAGNWNGGGMHASHDYGFGQVDARAAVRLAETWTQQNVYWNEDTYSVSSATLNAAVPDTGAALVRTLTATAGLKVESAQVSLTLTHQNWGDLIIKLISPSGTESVLVNRPGKALGSGVGDRGDAISGPMQVSFNTTHVRGEDSGGLWTLQVIDAATGQTGTLTNWKLDLYGADDNGDDTYVYTDEFKTFAGTVRGTLADTDGGIDTLNAAAVTSNSSINLNAGTASVIAGKSLVVTGALENAVGGDGNDTLTGNVLANMLMGGRGNDTLSGGGGNDRLEGGKGNDTMTGGTGTDIFVIRRDAGSIDTIVDFDTASVREKILLAGFDDIPDFTALTLTQSGADVRIAMKQGQVLVLKNRTVASVSEQNFTFIATDAYVEEYIARWSNTVVYPGTAGADEMLLPEGQDLSAFGLGGDDYLSSVSPNDLLDGGNGNDIIMGDEPGYTPYPGSDWMEGGAGDDGMDAGPGDDMLSGGSGDDSLHGKEGQDYLVGGTGLDYLDGGDGNDIVTLDGDMGQVVNGVSGYLGTRVGGTGADVFKVLAYGGGTSGYSIFAGDFRASNLIADFEVNRAGERIDLTAFTWIRAFSDLTLQTFTEGGVTFTQVTAVNGTERLNLTLYGVAATQLRTEHFVVSGVPGEVTGTASGNTLTGDAGANLIGGRAGADIMIGRTGDDTYIVDNIGDVVTELPGGGYDTVRSGVSYTLTPDVEALVLTGAANIDGTGNALRNRLVGNAGSNYLDGGEEADEMIGGAGNDYYTVDDQLDKVVELAGEGIDMVNASVSWTLGQNIENLALTGADDINGTGNELANVLIGNQGDNVLDGAGGNDVMQGGLGNDTYFVDSAGDIINEVNGAGYDVVYTAVNLTLAANVEAGQLIGAATSLTGNELDNDLRGNALANVLVGGIGNDRLDGGAGADSMNGGAGDDTYWVDNSGDTIVELANGGVDTVVSSINVNLSTLGGGYLENAVLTGSANLNLSGNSSNNELTGNAGNNALSGGAGNDWLDGGEGADTMAGGAGDDVYVVDNTGDAVTELAAQGIDQVDSLLAAYTLGANVENGRILAYGAANMTGNTLANLLYAGSGNNVIDGGSGSDTLSYLYADAAVQVSLALTSAQNTGSSGVDTVRNVEHLTGSVYDDVLSGNLNANMLDGGLGADSMAGGTGNDTYVVDNAGDIVVEAANEGTDQVNSYLADYTLSANVEYGRIMSAGAANMTGNGIANLIYAGDGDNVINGGAGSDTVSYNYAKAGVTVNLSLTTAQDTGGSGRDTLISIERITGSLFDDVLIGTIGANVFNGQVGNDMMIGGAGSDSYYVQDGGDVVVEENVQGTDIVLSYLSDYTLGANVENLRLMAAGAANGKGNELDNLIYAGAGNNVLGGSSGNDTVSYLYATSAVTVSLALTSAQNTVGSGTDTLTGFENLSGSNYNDTLTGGSNKNVLAGGLGNDRLIGGAGGDTYLLNRGDGSDTLVENDATAGNTDVALFGTGVAEDQLWFRQVGNALEVSIIGTSDKFTVTDWYLGSSYHVEQFRTSARGVLLDTDVQNLVTAMAAFSPPAAGQTEMPQAYQTALAPVIAANWH